MRRLWQQRVIVSVFYWRFYRFQPFVLLHTCPAFSRRFVLPDYVKAVLDVVANYGYFDKDFRHFNTVCHTRYGRNLLT